MRPLEDKVFFLLLAAVSIAFAWIVWQFYGAVLWTVVIAVLFAPLNTYLAKSILKSPTLAALASVAIIVLIVILPLALMMAALAKEASAVFESIQSGQFDVDIFFQKVIHALPLWVRSVLDWLGFPNILAVQQRLSNSLGGVGQFVAGRILNIGQDAAELSTCSSCFICCSFCSGMALDLRGSSRKPSL